MSILAYSGFNKPEWGDSLKIDRGCYRGLRQSADVRQHRGQPGRGDLIDLREPIAGHNIPLFLPSGADRSTKTFCTSTLTSAIRDRTTGNSIISLLLSRKVHTCFFFPLQGSEALSSGSCRKEKKGSVKTNGVNHIQLYVKEQASVFAMISPWTGLVIQKKFYNGIIDQIYK